MKVPFHWLKEYLPLGLSVEQVAEILTLLGLEVEGIDRPKFSFSDIVVGEILTADRHPNADRLRIATVTDGRETYQIVCGASNCRAGLKTALAKIGATLQEPDGKTFKIKKSKLRDVESFGMLCSPRELGLAEGAEGILELPADAPVGTSLTDILSEPILEISVTPNLGHCLSMIGIARELSAHQNIPLHIPQGHPPEDDKLQVEKMLDIALEAKEACPRYSCRYMFNITIGPSPDWLKKRLEAAGVKSINNIVDIGNYVMLETGQPLHMFDAAKIHGKKIVIHQAPSEGDLITLDGNTTRFAAGTLLISDAAGPLALAGIMGGQASAISPDTKEIAIESACFQPSSIRSGSKRSGLRSESSYRFERGIDKGGVVQALNRAAGLVAVLAGGVSAQGVIDLCPEKVQPRSIHCRVDRVNRLLGLSLSQNEVAELLRRLGMHVKPEDSDRLHVIVPTFRNDILQEIDLIEEVARLYGYNNIPKTLPRHISAPFADAPIFTFENTIRSLLIRERLQECLTCDLISPAQASLIEKQGLQQDALIHVLHPHSADQSVLRHSLLPGLLQVVKHNQDQGISDIAAFEVGKIHFRYNGQFKEQLMAGIVLCGKKAPYYFQPQPSGWDFFDLKGLLESLLSHSRLSDFDFAPTHLAAFHPYRQARIAIRDQTLGVLSEIHPEILRSLKIKQSVLFAEINLHDLFPLWIRDWHVLPLPSFPGSERDWTLTVQEHTPIASLFTAIRSSAPELLSECFLLDIYKSDLLGLDKKNVTIRFIYRDPSKTIAMETVEKEHAHLMQRVAQKIRDHVV